MEQLAQNAPVGETVKEALVHFVPRLTDADAAVLAVPFTQEGASWSRPPRITAAEPQHFGLGVVRARKSGSSASDDDGDLPWGGTLRRTCCHWRPSEARFGIGIGEKNEIWFRGSIQNRVRQAAPISDPQVYFW